MLDLTECKCCGVFLSPDFISVLKITQQTTENYRFCKLNSPDSCRKVPSLYCFKIKILTSQNQLVELTASCHDAFASLLELINFLGSLLKAMLRFLSFSSSRLQLSLIRSCFGKYRGKNNQGKKGAEKSGLRMHNYFSTSTSSVDFAQNNTEEILQSFLLFMRLSSIGKIEAFLANLSVVVWSLVHVIFNIQKKYFLVTFFRRCKQSIEWIILQC